jgi:hypothetical protein
LWALLVSPILLPVFTRLHSLIFDSRSALWTADLASH